MIIKSAFCQSLIEKELQDFKDISFTLHGDNRPSDHDLSLSDINIYWHSEPEEYFGNHSWIGNNWQKFDAVLTWNISDMPNISYIPNAIFCPFGTSAFHDRNTDHPGPLKKDMQVSFIRGNKHFDVPGHHLRWELWEKQYKLNISVELHATTIPEYASTPEEEIQWFAQRQHIFQDSMFHIAIENTAHNNYFTEKIIDCFLFKTVPIYYGCPNINEFFNPNGIITFNTIDELIEICNNLTYDDYINRIDAVYENQIKCMEYLNIGKTVHKKLQTFFKFNGLL